MKLLSEELRATLPPLYAQEGNTNPIVHAKFFTPDSNWTWFVTEGSAEEDDFIFFATSSALKRNGATSPFRSWKVSVDPCIYRSSATFILSRACGMK
jgi:hypothetical protein